MFVILITDTSGWDRENIDDLMPAGDEETETIETLPPFFDMGQELQKLQIKIAVNHSLRVRGTEVVNNVQILKSMHTEILSELINN